LAIDLTYPDAYYNKGRSFNALGRHDEAIAEYDKALAIDPNDEEAHNWRNMSRFYIT
jgi:tetratricopeptide (TPR) repeat protein